jgi:effector-binding domain-containing protein
MKVLKFLLALIVILILAVVILGFAGPKTYKVERSTTIDAPKEVVFPYLKSLQKMQSWSPWAERDPDMVNEYIGEDGTVGSKNKWTGNEHVGTGEQSITAIEENARVETSMKFISPRESESNGWLSIKDTDQGGSEILWGFGGENDFMGRVMGVFMNLDKMVGPDFEKGLGKLKNIVEGKMNDKYRGFHVKIVDLPTRSFLGVRKRIKMDKMQSFFESNLPRAYMAVQKAGLEMDGMPYGLYYDWDEKNGETDMAAAIPVKKSMKIPGFGEFKVESGRAAQIDYYGDYMGLGEAHYAIDDYLKALDLKMGSPVMEHYVTDPTTEADTSKWLTQITYPLDL